MNDTDDPFRGPVSYAPARAAGAARGNDRADDPHLTRLVSRALSARRMFPAVERLLAYLVDSAAPGWTNTVHSRNHLHREVGDAQCEPDPVAAALRKIRRRGEMEASLDEAFGDDDFDVFANGGGDPPAAAL